MAQINYQQEQSKKVRLKLLRYLKFTIVGTAFGAIVILVAFSNGLKTDLTLFRHSKLIKHTLTKFCWQKDSTPYGEIGIPYFKLNRIHRISKFRCTGSENDIEAWADRLCVLYHICYDLNIGRFYYFGLPGSKRKPIFYDAAKRMLFQFGKNNGSAKFLSLMSGGGLPWGPIISNEMYPVTNVTRLYRLHSLMKTRFADNSIAHGLWEDLGSVSYSMDRMNIFDQKLVIMHLGNIPNSTLFRQYHQYVIPALTENPMVEFESYVKSFKTKYVCFDGLIAGGQLSVFPRPQIKENHGREALFYNWRSKIIRYNGFDPDFVPRRHHIVITNKSHSIWTHPGSKMHRAIVNLEEVTSFIRLTYPTISSEVIEWHTISIKKQIEKLLSTTILITPCGSVSLIIPFLPHGAHAIVMDYYVNKAVHGYHIGESGSMEGAFLNHLSHVRKQYYQVYGPNDYKFDFPGATDTREQSSVVVNMTRLKLIIDKALEEMEP